MKKSGQILIEAIVSVSVAMIALLGILGLVSRSLAINTDIGNKLTGTYLAAEGIEVVKNIIDTNYTSCLPWGNGINNGSYEVDATTADLNVIAQSTSTPLLYANGIYSYGAGTPSVYSRVVDVTTGNDFVSVVSTAYWDSHGRSESVSLQDYFYNWRTPNNPTLCK